MWRIVGTAALRLWAQLRYGFGSSRIEAFASVKPSLPKNCSGLADATRLVNADTVGLVGVQASKGGKKYGTRKVIFTKS
jgi:hypothetical protein